MGEITREIARGAHAGRRSPAAQPPPRVHARAPACARASCGPLSLALVDLPVGPHQPADPAADDRARGAGGRTLRHARRGRRGRDEVGVAIEAFNGTAGQLQRNRDRLVYLTQVASWQLLARKMAHELKNSLTPIRLTVEEIAARQSSADPEFFERAAAIVVDEVTSLERRVRAFSEFAAEPEAHPSRLDLDALVRERVDLLRAAHPGVTYRVEPSGRRAGRLGRRRPGEGHPHEPARERRRGRGRRRRGARRDRREPASDAVVEVHDSGPGVSAEARSRLFEPSISVQEARHGAGPGHLPEERAAGRRRPRARRGAAGRRGIPARHPVIGKSGTVTAKTILIVDDEENVGASLRLVLEGAGYRVEVCRTAADFRRRLRALARRRVPAGRAAAGRQRHRPAAARRGAAPRRRSS